VFKWLDARCPLVLRFRVAVGGCGALCTTYSQGAQSRPPPPLATRMALHPRRSRRSYCRRHRHCCGTPDRRAAAAAARGTARVTSGGGRSGVGSCGVPGGFSFSVTLALPPPLGASCSEVHIALRAFFEAKGPAVLWSAID